MWIATKATRTQGIGCRTPVGLEIKMPKVRTVKRQGGRKIIYDSSDEFEEVKITKMKYKCESCQKNFEKWGEFCKHIRVCIKVTEEIAKIPRVAAVATKIKKDEDTRTRDYRIEVETDEASTRRMEEEATRAAELMEELDQIRQVLINDRAWNRQQSVVRQMAEMYNDNVSDDDGTFVPDDFADDEADQIMMSNALNNRGIDISGWIDTNDDEAQHLLMEWRRDPEEAIRVVESMREGGEL